MTTLFAQNRGAVAKVALLPRDRDIPFKFKMEGMQTFKAIITQATVQQQVNAQFLETIGDTIYAYIFGDKMGSLAVSGVAFANPCQDLGGNARNGFAELFDKYNAFRASKTGKPVTVQFGLDDPFKSYLVGMKIDVTDAENQLGQWSFMFRAPVNDEDD